MLVDLRQKNWSLDSHTLKKKNKEAGSFRFLLFQLGTFLDILVCLVKQMVATNKWYFEMQVFSLTQHKQIVIYRFSLQVHVSKNTKFLWFGSQLGQK